METRANYLLVASFVLAIIACSIAAAILLLNLHPIPATRAFYEIYFNGSVAGLKIGAPVSEAGIPIGTVRKIELDPEDPNAVHVTIEVRKDAPIRSDSIASLDVNLVYGDASISLTAGTERAPPFTVLPGRAYPIIGSRASQLEGFAERATDFMQRTIEVSDTLIEFLDDRKLQAISEGLQTAQRSMAGAVGQARDIGSMIDEAGATVHEAQAQDIALQARLREISESLVTAQANLQDATAIIKRVDDWVDGFDQVVQGLRPLLTGMSGNLRDLDGTILEARGLVGHFARYVDDLARHPHAELFGKTGAGGYRPK